MKEALLRVVGKEEGSERKRARAHAAGAER